MNAAVQARDKSKSGGILASLKFSHALQPKKSQADQQRTPRQVLADFLTQQIAVVDGDIAGQEVTFRKTRFIRNADGSSTKKTVDVHVRKSYWRDGASQK